MIEQRRVMGAVIGVAVGDALGFPVVDSTRAERRIDPVDGMRVAERRGGPPGMWSEATAQALRTVRTLLDHDSPAASAEALDSGSKEWPASEGEAEFGLAIIRTLPISIFYCRRSISLMLERVHEAASLTNPDPACLIACGLAALTMRNLLHNRPPRAAYRYAAEYCRDSYLRDPWRIHRPQFRRILRGTIGEATSEQISSQPSGVETLEGAMWSVMTTKDYREAVVRAVNLGTNAAQRGALAGGLAGVAYGYESIPEDWIEMLNDRADLLRVAERFTEVTTA